MDKGIGTILIHRSNGSTCKITYRTDNDFTIEYEDDNDFTVEYSDNKEVKKCMNNNLENFVVDDDQKDITNELKQTIKEQEKKLAEKDEQIRQLQEKLNRQMKKYENVGRKAQISEETIKQILEEVDKKTPYRQIAKMFGCSIGTISFFVQREREEQMNKEKEVVDSDNNNDK